MVRNEARRAELADAGIRLLAEEGSRGLTHRAVDARAGAPRGTASNYFPTREDLITALVERIGDRLGPDPEAVRASASQSSGRGLFAAYLHDVVRRLRADPSVQIALFELRLEASRRPSVAATLGSWRQREFENDVRFNDENELPGGASDIALFHFAVDGLLLDQLTVPLVTGLSPEDAVEAMVDRLLP